MSTLLSIPNAWHSRGYLPHFDGGAIPQFVTFRLADSLRQKLLEKWRSELEEKAPAFRRRIELFLDQNYGQCYLRDPTIAQIVQNALLFFDGKRYKLSAWIVMPNHVHLLMTPQPGYTLSRILQSLKSYTGNEANKIVNRHGRFWQTESFDRYIRDANHFYKVIAYIENNPVKARLCSSPSDWPFSSAAFRSQAKQ